MTQGLLKTLWNKITGKLSGKLNTLVSGLNIKTINNQSLLASGDLTTQHVLNFSKENNLWSVDSDISVGELTILWLDGTSILPVIINGDKHFTGTLDNVGDEFMDFSFIIPNEDVTTYTMLILRIEDTSGSDTMWVSTSEIYKKEIATTTDLTLKLNKDLVVNLTYENGTYTADKTRTEIVNAINADRNVIVLCNKRIYFILYCDLTANIYFSCNEGDLYKVKVIRLTNQGAWSNTEYVFQPKLTFDSTPTSTSTNPVTSDGIYNALEIKLDKNFVISITQSGSTYTADKTRDEIITAHDANKILIVRQALYTYNLAYYNTAGSSDILFICVDKYQFRLLILKPNNTWLHYIYDYQSKLTTAGSSTLPVYINGSTPTEITSLGDAYISWGGKNLAGEVSPVDASLIDDLGANRLAFLKPEQITVEYSSDNGATWIDYGLSDTNKIALVSGIGTSISLGANASSHSITTSDLLRITINVVVGTNTSSNIYCRLNKFAIFGTGANSSDRWVKIEGRTNTDYVNDSDTWLTIANKTIVKGNSGWSIVNTPVITTTNTTSDTSNYRQLRFTFGADIAYTGSYSIYKILAFGYPMWTSPSNMANTGHIYTWTAYQETIFPQGIRPAVNNAYQNGGTSLRWSNIYSVLGNFSGKITASGGIEVPNGQTITINSVPVQTQRTVQQETVSSNAVTIALDATKYHTCSAPVDNITLTLPASYTAADVFSFSFTCNSSSCVLTLPSGVYLGNGQNFFVDRLAGRKFQVTISDGIALYCFADVI